MAQEFTINSEAIESKINSLLPSQGGYGAGIDFSASTMIIPIIDLTATAGYWNIRGGLAMTNRSSGSQTFNVSLTDGITTKIVYAFNNPNYGSSNKICVDINLDVFLASGDSCIVTAGVQTLFDGYVKQIASIDGTASTPS